MEDNINNLDMIFDAGGDPGVCSAPVRDLSSAVELQPGHPIVGLQPEPTEQPDDEATVAGASWKESNPTELPREKAMKYGIESLETVELMAILLHTGIKGKSVLELSADILRESDNRLSHLSRLSIHELKNKFKGLGDAKATTLAAAFALGARAHADMQVSDPQLTSSQTVYQCMAPQIKQLNYEVFYVLHLNRSNRLQWKEKVSQGGLAMTAVDPRLIAKSALDRLSSAVILCHNHPSGNLGPSQQDDQLTRRIVDVLKIIDVQVLDHIIIGQTGYYSYRDEGRL